MTERNAGSPAPRSGEGGPREAWWKGRRTQQNSFDARETASQTPPPPRKSAVPLPRYRGAGSSVLAAPLCARVMPTPSREARRPGSVRKPKGWGPGFSKRYAAFANSISTAIKNRKQDADKRCLTTSAPSGAALPRLRDSSPVGVPPQLSPRGVVVPKVQLQAKVSWRRGLISVTYRRLSQSSEAPRAPVVVPGD